MNKEEFRAKAYPILLEALLRATNGDNVQVLVGSYIEKNEALRMISVLTSVVSIDISSCDSISLENKAVIKIDFNSSDGYNHTLEIV